jgi:hypothetical protein
VIEGETTEPDEFLHKAGWASLGEGVRQHAGDHTRGDREPPCQNDPGGIDTETRIMERTGKVLVAESLDAGERLCALRIADRQVLLLCKKGGSAALTTGVHDGEGRLHLALAVPQADLVEWEARLTEHGIVIEERHTWDQTSRFALTVRMPLHHRDSNLVNEIKFR